MNYIVQIVATSTPQEFKVYATIGDKGWSPNLIMVQRDDGAMVARREWVGGQGNPPSGPEYVALGGYTSDINEAVPFKEKPFEIHQGSIPPGPDLGVDGDLYFLSVPAGVELYQKLWGSWGSSLVSIPRGIQLVQNDELDYETPSSTLNSLYPDLIPGDVVYSKSSSGHIKFTKLLNNEWTMESITIIQ